MGACVCKDDKGQQGGGIMGDPVQIRNGAVELKQNYSISSTSKILGAGQFGKVFLSHNIADPSLEVAIKLFNKTKLKNN